jgi:hypothetical protein
MRSIIWIAVLTLFTSASWACDICSIYLGINPTDYQNSFGFNYRTRYLHGKFDMNGMIKKSGPKHAAHISDPLAGQTVKEIFNVMEFRGKYYFTDRFNVLATVPVLNNYRSIGGWTSVDLYGVGDPILMVNYQVYSTTADKETQDFAQRLVLGGGAKFPLGAVDRQFDGEKVDLDMQPGTGSMDYLASLEYQIRYKKVGLNTNFIYKLNSANKEGYRYGDLFNTSIHLFSLLEVKSFKIVPNAGVYYEQAGKDHENDDLMKESGGRILFASGGAGIYFKKFAYKITCQHALNNQLNGNQLPTKNRFVMGLSYNF